MAYNIGPKKNLNDDIDEIEEEKGSEEEDMEGMDGEGMDGEFDGEPEDDADQINRDENASPDFFEINNVDVEEEEKQKALAMEQAQQPEATEIMMLTELPEEDKGSEQHSKKSRCSRESNKA